MDSPPSPVPTPAAGDATRFMAARREFTLCLCAVMWCHFGFFYGMSPLNLPVAKAFRSETEYIGGAFLIGSGIMLTFINVVSGLCVFVLPLTLNGYRRTAAIGMITWVAGVLLLALAVWRVAIWLFVAAFIPLGVGMGIFNLFFHLELTKLYKEAVGKAHAWGGFFIGLGAIVHAIIFGTMSEVFDVQRTLLGICVLHFAVMGVAWHVGWSHLSFYDTGMEGSVANGSVQTRVEVEDRATPALKLLVTWRMIGVLLLFFGVMFCGMAMKMLQSTVFEQALDMSHLESTFYSAFCLCFYWGCRTVSPLLSSAGDGVFGLYFCVLLVECAAYALTPLAIMSGKPWVFTVFRILSGGAFATLNANVTPLIAKMFGLRDLHVAIAVCSWFEPLAAFGAVFAWVMHIDHDAAGGSTQESYNKFFYIESGMVGACALIVAMLAADKHWSENIKAPNADRITPSNNHEVLQPQRWHIAVAP